MPKKSPRACGGATSVPSVCMFPEMMLIARCTNTKLAMNQASDNPANAVTDTEAIERLVSISPGTMVYFLPNRSITNPVENRMGTVPTAIALRSTPSSAGSRP